MEYIDMEKWKRKDQFNFFHRMDYPQYNICANIDITKFLNYARNNEILFYYAMIHASTCVANGTVNFRYRIRKDGVVLHDRLHPSFTELDENDGDLFKLVTVEMNDDIFAFVKSAKEKSHAQTEFINSHELADRDDLIYITCIPWISFTHLSHTISLNKDDAVPRISWGKYFTDGNKVLLPFSVQVNHALVDGVHIGEYFAKLQEHIDHF